MNYYHQTQMILQHLNVVKDSKSPLVSPKVLLVFTGSKEGMEEMIPWLVKQKEKGYKFEIAFSNTALDILNIQQIRESLRPEKVHTEENTGENNLLLRDDCKIWVITTSQNTVVKLALGIQDQFIPKLLWRALWQGKELWINTQYVLSPKSIPSKNPMLQQIMRTYLESLEEMGVNRLENIDEIKENKKEWSEFYIKEKNVKDRKKEVVTEEDILRCSKEIHEIIVPIDAIITPLAKDTAKGRGIVIRKR